MTSKSFTSPGHLGGEFTVVWNENAPSEPYLAVSDGPSADSQFSLHGDQLRRLRDTITKALKDAQRNKEAER